jgi:hypothetical protein
MILCLLLFRVYVHAFLERYYYDACFAMSLYTRNRGAQVRTHKDKYTQVLHVIKMILFFIAARLLRYAQKVSIVHVFLACNHEITIQ